MRFCPSEKIRDSLSQLPPGLVIDVGALDGADAVNYARAGHEVISFEASPSKSDRIRSFIAKASDVSQRISFHNVALADKDGILPFYQSGDGSDQDSLTRPPWFNEDKSMHVVDVPTKTLDFIVGNRNVTYLKIDAQGNDPSVLRGGKALIGEKSVGIIQFEVAPNLSGTKTKGEEYVKIVHYLSANGYMCYDCNFPLINKRNGIPFIQAIHIEIRIESLLERKFMFKGSNHGQWTNFVCLQQEWSPEASTYY